MRAENYSVARIVQDDHSFFVPKYQRLSSWEREHYTQFIEDILDDEEMDSKDSSDGYFVGTFILKPDSAGENTKLYEVIDGQQRLIAISLLLAALYKIAEDLKNEYNVVSTDLLVRLGIVSENIKGFLIRDNFKKRTKELRFTASKYEKNDLNFRKILHDCRLDISFNAGDLFRQSLMTKSFKYYEKSLRGKVNFSSPEENVNAIEKISKSLKKISFIIIEVENQSNACQLFASFNDRGKPLVAMDIIKNMFFDKGGIKQEDVIFEKWNGLTENLRSDEDKNKGNNSGASQHSDRYLRHFYNAFNKEGDKMFILKSPISKRKLTHVYGKLISEKDKIPSQALVANLYNKSKIYNAITDPQEYKFEKKGNVSAQAFEIKNDDVRKAIVEGLSDLNEVKGAPANVLLLYLFSKFSQKSNAFKDGEKAIQEIINFLVKFFVRRNISQHPRTNIMDPLMDRIIDNCEGSLYKIQRISSINVEEFTIDDSEIYNKKRFKKDIVNFEASGSFDRTLAKNILMRVSNYHERSAGKRNPFFNARKDHELEHILPQSLPPFWIKEFLPEEETEKDEISKELCEFWVHKLGNLTLTNGNPNLSNRSFKDKQNDLKYGYKNTKLWLDGDEKLNGLIFDVLNEGYALATSPTWNKLFVEGRTIALATHIANYYQFKSEEKN